MKKVSVSAELAVSAATLLVEVERQGGVGDEDVPEFTAAVLSLASTRLRDLGRVVRGSQAVQGFAAPHNEAVKCKMVPSRDWFIYAFIRKEAVVSRQTEGTEATLDDLLTLEASAEGPGPIRTSGTAATNSTRSPGCHANSPA